MSTHKKMNTRSNYSYITKTALLFFLPFCFSACKPADDKNINTTAITLHSKQIKDSVPVIDSNVKNSTLFDTALYNSKMLTLVHNNPSAKWPVKAPYPRAQAILPFSRIIAYYGNFYSKNMGILGALPTDEMLLRLKKEADNWAKADSLTPVIPAIHYIAVTAQASPGKNSKYRQRMPFSEIDKAVEIAKKINGIVFLDIQVGWSSLQEEIPPLEKYLLMPNVHLGIDPEFSMKGRQVPGSVIGTMDAADINFASAYLANITKEHNLPPKILVLHRFTKGMITNYTNIITRPEVQIVINMDGFGSAAKKISSYKLAVINEPVQFAGFKVFYKNDALSPGSGTIMQPSEILKLYPVPVYIQYQ